MEKNPEKKEVGFQRVELKVHHSDVGHTWGIEFDESTPDQAQVYQLAILGNETCRNEFGVFHQSGKPRKGGYQYFEFLKLRSEEDWTQKISNLFGGIHETAEKFLLVQKKIFLETED